MLDKSELPVAIIRTSDRSAFKRCRRRWALSSGLRRNRTAFMRQSYFWIGTGCHFAMEDYHGHNYYGHPAEAFRAYYSACKKLAKKDRTQQLPDDASEQAELAKGMLDYYLEWLSNREQLQTLWIDGQPLVEVRIQIPLPFESPYYSAVLYDMTLDRIVEYRDDLYIVDYKFLQSLSTGNLDYDLQISSYLWGGTSVLPREPHGFIYQQHLKDLPEAPRILSSGLISTDKTQRTTHRMYRNALLDMYGTIERAPAGQVKTMNQFAAEETEHMDKFIRRDVTTRTHEQLENMGEKILMEVEDMLNPDLHIYPNETRDCHWDCDFRDICLMMDRNDDWEFELVNGTVERQEMRDSWRQHL